MDLKQFRAQYPQYEDLADQELAAGLHKKFYSDIPFDDFLKQLTPGPAPDTGFFDMVGRAGIRGAKQTGSLLADVLPAMVGKAVGADEYAARQMAEAEETQKEIAQNYAARYGELSDVKGLGDVLPFIAETVAEQVPNLATSIIPGVGGAMIGGRLAAGQAAKTLAGREATEAAARYAALKGAQGAGRGALGGAFLGSYALSAPEVFQNIYEETKDPETGEGQMELGASLLAGSVAAALDSILPAYLVRQFTPGMKAGVVEKLLARSGMPPGIARGATAGVITGAATEAPTEAAQEAISIAAEKFVQDNAPAWGGKEFNRLVESFVRGGAGGGGISGVAGAVKGYGDRPKPEPSETATGLPGGSALDQLDTGEVDDQDTQQGFEEFKRQEPLFTPEQVGALSEEATKTVEAGQEQETPPAPPAPPSATPTADAAELQGIRKQISEISGAIRDLENRGADEALLEDWYAEREKLQAQERALRRGETSEGSEILRAGPGMGPKKLGERRTYKLTPAERAVTEEDLRAAGFMPYEIQRIMFNAKPESASPLAKETLSKVAEGQILFGADLRAVTPEDIANAQTPQERARLEAAIAKSQQRLLPAQQMGLDLAAATDETDREFKSPIEMSEQEFELTAPQGQVARETKIETEQGPPAAPLNLVGRNTNLLETLFNYLSPSVQAEQGVDNYNSLVTNFLGNVKEYVDSAEGPNRKENLALINEFFNRLGLTSDPKLAQGLVGALKGKSAAQQAQLLAERTRMPKLNTPDGMRQLRDMFQDFMEQQNIAKLGDYPGLAATKTFANDIYIPARIANILRQLRNKPEKYMTPEEKAFMAYMSKFKYGLAMRSAAFDLANGVVDGEMFSNQGKDSAAAFQKFVEENFPAQIFNAFNETISEYQKLNRRSAQASIKIEREQKRRKAYAAQLAQDISESERMEDIRKSLFRTNSSQAYFKPMHPAIEQQLRDGDIDGALAIIEKFPGAKYWQLLAKRFRALNLDTVSQVGDQERLIRQDLADIADNTNALNDNIRDVYPSIYDRYLAPAINEFGEINVRKYSKALKDIQKSKLLGPFTDSLQFKLVSDRYADGVASLEAPGFYMLQKDVISLNPAKGGSSYYAFFHELVHAATAQAIRNPSQLEPHQKKALDNLNELYTYAQNNYPSVYQYGFTSLDEFIAEAFSNTEFQNILSKMPYKTAESSLWSKFIQYVRSLLGTKDTALFATLANADVLMTAAQTRAPGSNRFTGTLMAGATKMKRTTKGTYKTAPDVARNKGWLDILSNRPTWAQSKSGVARMLENAADTTRKYYLGAFTLRQLQDLVGSRLGNSARNFIESVEGMLEEHNKIINESKEVLDRWTRLQSKDPAENDRTSLLMIDTTLAGIDPDITSGKDLELDRRWAALSLEAKTVYREVRDFYKRRIDSYRSVLLRNIELSLIASGESSANIKKKLQEVSKKLDLDSVQPYFPLQRFGQYWVQIGTGEKKEFYMFESAADKNAFRDATRAEFDRTGDTRSIEDGNSLRDYRTSNLQDISALQSIQKIIDTAAVNDPIMGNQYVSAKNKVDTLREAIKDGVNELYILTLPSQSIRKNFLNRKGVSGASKDMLRVFADNSNHMAYQHARFKFSRQMFQQLETANDVLRLNARSGKPDTAIDRDYVVELERRLEYVMNPSDTGTIPTTLSNVSFMWYLTAPASALVNMLGVPAFGFPILAARFGKAKAAAMLATMGKRFLFAGFKDKDGNYAMPSLVMTELTPAERKAHEIFTASGLIDITQAHDIVGMAESSANMYTSRMSTVMRWSSFMFHHAERFNREVMAMSTFKLAYQAAKDAKLSPEAAFNKAIDQAKDLTYRSMFDYSTLNKPRYLQNAYSKVILQFKQFPQHTTYLLTRSGLEWFSKDNPKLREEVLDYLRLEYTRYGQAFPTTEADQKKLVDAEMLRVQKEGRDRLLGTLGMTFLMAGATGMPLFSVGSAVIESLYAAFSDDDEPPLNFENWFKNWMATTFGDFWGDSVSRGLVTQATGMNFADRMSLNDMWFRDARKSQDEVTAFQNMIINLLGPTAALGISAAEALKLYNDGQYYRGAEKMLPAVLRQPLVAARYSTEGVLTLKGDELVSDISAKDALSQSLGFSPEKVAQRQKSNIEMKSAEQDIKSKRQDLMNAFFMSIDTQDFDFRERVLDKIAVFNRKHPGAAISATSLQSSVKNRYKLRGLASMTGGIPIDKKLMFELQEMGYYGDE
jgi:hypothetical protein